MSGLTTLQKAGLFVTIGSLLLGFGGTVWSIYGSFAALENAENAGIGPVSDFIQSALVFSGLGLIGLLIGILLLIFGRRKNHT